MPWSRRSAREPTETAPFSLFENPTVAAVARFLLPNHRFRRLRPPGAAGANGAASAAAQGASRLSRDDGRTLPADHLAPPRHRRDRQSTCRSPGADGPDAFWWNLREGVESVSFFSDEELQAAGIPESVYPRPQLRARPRRGQRRRALRRRLLSAITRARPRVMDPQQRLFPRMLVAGPGVRRLRRLPRVRGGRRQERAAVVGVMGAGSPCRAISWRSIPLQERLRSIGVDTTMAGGGERQGLAGAAGRLQARPARPRRSPSRPPARLSLVAVHMALSEAPPRRGEPTWRSPGRSRSPCR